MNTNLRKKYQCFIFLPSARKLHNFLTLKILQRLSIFLLSKFSADIDMK